MYRKLIYLFFVVVLLALVGSADGQVGKGNILIEYWNNIGGGAVSDLTNNARYPDEPDESEWLTSFDRPYNRPAPNGDNYGARLRGYLYPTGTGDYSFWVASDDASEVWLSTDDDPANAVRICWIDGWCPAYDWDNTAGTDNPDQDSAPVPLVAGQRYYIEAIYKEAGGGDGLAVAWQGPGVATRAVIDGKYLSPWIRHIDLIATNPNPADGATGVMSPALTWTSGKTAVFHNVYLGTSPDLGPADLVTTPNWQYAMYWHLPGFTAGVTYYWRVDEVEADGTTTHTGDVWSFTAAPLTAYDPDPPDGARYVSVDADLSWSPGRTAATHDVYFGTDETEVANGTGGTFKGNEQFANYEPGTLLENTKYYWRIDEVEGTGTKHTGEVWSFSTDVVPITNPNLIAWWKLDGGFGNTAFDWSGYNNHAVIGGTPDFVPGYDGDALDFDGETDYIDFNGSLLTGDFTLTMWIRPRDIPYTSGYYAVLHNDAWNAGSVHVHLRANTSLFNADINSGPGVSSTTVLQEGEWYHCALTVTTAGGNASSLYINGVFESSGSGGSGTPYLGPMTIGAWDDGTTRHYHGLMDDIRVYDIELTADEIPDTMRGDPTLAWKPRPTHGSAPDIEHATPLSWSPGEKAAEHDVYFGTDRDAVLDADTAMTGVYRGRIDPNSYTPPEGVQIGETYYWRIDEFNTDATISEGRVWNFTVADYLIIDDFDAYDDYCNRIFYAWPDGWGHNGDLACGVPPYGGNGTGSTVGYLSEPYAEQTITHDGSFQSMPFEFLNDGSTGKALYSETERTFEFPQDFTRKGMKSLTLWYQGQPGSVGSFSYDAPTDIYTMTADGWDIEGTADGFHYAFKQLSGVGSIQAQVLSVQNTNTWAKAGVMIRETLDANSVQSMTVVTPGQGVSFQRRAVTGQGTEHTTLGGFQAPHWVRISRSGNDFTSEHSADGATWETIGTQNIPMAATVYVGMALTSHTTGATCEATFSDVTITGTVAGQWQSQDIGIASNDAERLYVALEDSTGTVKDVPHPDPNAVQLDTWQEWNIDLAEFVPVDLTRVKKVYIGVGNRNAPALGGGGMLYIDDIRLYAPRCIPSLVKPAADFISNCIVDYPDLEILADNWLRIVWDPTGGHDGGSLAFGPTGDYVAIEDLSYNSTGLTAVSVSAWIRTDSEADQYIASFDRNEYWRLEINGSGGGPGQVGWDVMTDTGQVDYGSAARVDDGLWHHVVGVFNNGTLTIYIDGSAESPATGGTTFGTGNTRFGFLGANSEATTFDGARGGGNPVQQLDDFRIYDYALSAVDVTRLAQGTGQPVTGPILWYKLDETSGSVAADSSGNGYDGHLMFSWFEMNLHDDTTIDFKDYAVLADTFLDEVLWP